MQKPIYLDYNATTPIDPAVADAMQPFLSEYFGNPSSSHWYGVQTKLAVEKARRQAAAILNCSPEEIIFSSGGSESNNYAIKGAALANRQKGNHIITSAIEHPAVYEVCEFLAKNGFEITYLPVDEYGVVRLDALEEAISRRTILITIMHSNNEVGTLQPIKEIAAIAKKYSALLHTDASQSIGKVKVDAQELGVDLLTVAGHKVYAPKGIGALYIRQGTRLEKQVHGADHELNKRAGTENVTGIVGLGQACEVAAKSLDQDAKHSMELRDLLFNSIQEKIPEVKLNGHPVKRLPNTLSLSFPGVEANMLLDELDGVAASAGAACHSDSIDISPTLTAMGVPIEYAMGTIRFSTGRFLSRPDIEKAAEQVAAAVARIRPSGEGQTVSAPENSGKVKLTHFTHGLGCACKLRPQALELILRDLPVPDDARVLVGASTSDDAAVYQINQQTAIVQTVDFFTPIVDEPYHFGAIAAANAFSDIYAMGGKPLFALNIVGFPSNRLPMATLREILQGAHDKAKEANVSIIGGHTIDDTEPKFGLAVTGVISPDKILTNANAQPGDALILTKPLGLGILTTAIKRGMVEQNVIDMAIALMSRLNRTAAECLDNFDVHACTDVTGFGLLGHLKEMTLGANLQADISSSQVPVIPEARDLAVANIVPGGTLNNMEYVADIVEWSDNIAASSRILLCDAQTSGGLLIALPETQAVALVETLRAKDVIHAAIIGRMVVGKNGKICVR